MKTKYYIIIAAGIFLAGYLTSRYTSPERIVTVEKEVVKLQTDTKTVIKRVKSPDGTTTTEITKDHHTTKDSIKDKTFILNPDKLYRASLFTTTNFDKYGLVVERRIAGPLFVGGWVTTEKQVGLSVGIEF